MSPTRGNKWPILGQPMTSIKVTVCLAVVLAVIAIEAWASLEGKQTFAGGWGPGCPAPCSCEISSFSELPLVTRLLSPVPSQPKVQAGQDNEATYNEDAAQHNGQGELLKMAVCVLLPSVDANDLLLSLPADLQALTLLQGRGAGAMSLDAEALAHFPMLEVLDVQGLPTSTDRLTLSSHALAQLPALRYFNAEFLHLKPDKEDAEMDNEILPKPPGSSRLVFLEPAGNDLPLVSFTEFKQRRQAKAQDPFFSFAPLPSLKYLRAHACNLRELEWEMFRGLAQLESLSLERNDLLFIPEFVFYGTPALKSLSLAGNQLLGLQDTALAGLFNLEVLDLSSNNFSHLSELSLPPFPELRTADFRSNPVTAIYPSTFEIMNATARLFLGGTATPLTLLPNSFLGLASLRWLAVENVQVQKLETELLRGMPRLIELDMTGNVTSIAFDAFLHVPNLRRLSLKRCAIEHVSMDAFYGLRSLVELDLSENSLTTLPPGIFDQQIHIEDILLSDNQLTTLPTDLFSRLPAKMIRLDGNPWHCTCEMRGWKAIVINKVKGGKGPSILNSACAGVEGKGTACPAVASKISKYSFDKKVAPRCATPAKYRNWNVFHLLRKQLRCSRSLDDNKLQKSDYIQRKHAAYYASLKTVETVSTTQTNNNVNSSDALDAVKPNITTEATILPNEDNNHKGKNVIFSVKKMTPDKETTSSSSSSLNIDSFSVEQQQELRKDVKVMQPGRDDMVSTPSENENISLKHKQEKLAYYANKRTTVSHINNFNDDISPNKKEKKRLEEKFLDMDNILASSSSLNTENFVPNEKEDKKIYDNTVVNAEKNKADAKLFKKSWKQDAEKKRAEKLSRLRV